MKLVKLYQAGWVSDHGGFNPIIEIEPFDDIWEAYKWKRSRENNSDGWVPGFLEYVVVKDLPLSILHT